MRQAEVVIAELSATLEFLFDDGKDAQEDIALATLSDAHLEPTSQDAMALALEEYADLAKPQGPALAALGTFDVKTIGRARSLASRLRERSAPSDEDDRSQSLRLRNQLMTLLMQRMDRVRTAARYVFRIQPEVARLATSSYERRRRAEARRRARSTQN